MKKLNLDQSRITYGRKLAAEIVGKVREHIDAHTTVSVERAVLRLIGVDGVDSAGVPLGQCCGGEATAGRRFRQRGHVLAGKRGA